MKKKIIIPLVFILLAIGITCFILFNSRNKIASIITLDINPSIEIRLTKDNKVVKVVALNEDAKKIIKESFKGKTLEESVKTITEKVIENGYIDDDRAEILVYTKGNTTNVEDILADNFKEKNIVFEIKVIENITEEDEKLAKKYNITPAKASYINSIKKENENIDIESLVNKPVKELNETKTTGYYCDEGYILEGSWCLKEIRKTASTNGQVCQRGYYEYNGKCYEEKNIIDTGVFYCENEYKLENNKCVKRVVVDAKASKYTCNIGEAKTRFSLGLTGKEDGDANDIVCVDYSKATHPVSPCEANDGTEYTISGGTCYWHRAPVIASGCPGKIQVNGECWDNATGIYICPGYRDGKRYSSKDEYCEHSIRYLDPVITEYKCEDDYTLENNKCIKQETIEPFEKRICPSGFDLVDNDKCINFKNEKTKENGLVCSDKNARLVKNECVTYEYLEAKH